MPRNSIQATCARIAGSTGVRSSRWMPRRRTLRDELSSMFGDDEEALQAFEEGFDPDKD